MRIISNPNRAFSFFENTSDHSIGFGIIYPEENNPSGTHTLTWGDFDSHKFVSGLIAYLGQLGGIGPSPFQGSGTGAVIGMLARYYGQGANAARKLVILTNSNIGTADPNPSYTKEEFVAKLGANGDYEVGLASDLFEDFWDILTAPYPKSIPLGIPGKQWTLGQCAMWPAGNDVAKMRLIINSGAPFVSFVFNDNGNTVTVSPAQMVAILNCLMGTNGGVQVLGFLPEAFYIGMLYQNGVVGGVEIMESGVRSDGSADHVSLGQLWNPSLAQFCYNVQASYSRLVACLPVLDFTNQKTNGAGGVVDANVVSMDSALRDSFASQIVGYSQQVYMPILGPISTNVDRTLQSVVDELSYKIEQIAPADLDIIVQKLNSLDSHDATRTGALLVASLFTLRRSVSAKTYAKLLTALEHITYTTDPIQDDDRLSKSSAGPLAQVYDILDEGRINTTNNQGDQDDDRENNA